MKNINSKLITSVLFLTVAGSSGLAAEKADAVKEMNEMLANYFCYDTDSVFKSVCESKNKIACEFYAESDSISFPEIKRLCSENTASACTVMGHLYQNLHGDTVKKDLPASEKFYEKACELGDGDACYWLGRFYADGTAGKKDYQKSLTYLNKSCGLDDPQGCRLLGIMYETGTGVKQNLDSAFKYYEKSCRWIGDGCRSLSYLYLKGKGVKQDPELAVHYYLLSEKEFDSSYNHDENSIISGSEFPLKEFKEQLKNSCDADDARSCLLLGRIYDISDESSEEDQEDKEGNIYFEKACDLNLAEGCDFAGSEYGLYEVQDYGVTNFEQAEKYLKKGCELNSAHACAHLAALYSIFPYGHDYDANDKQEVSSESKRQERIKNADILSKKACTLDPGMVFGNFQMTMDNVLMSSYSSEYSFKQSCSKYQSGKDPLILMQACDLNDASACQELLEYHLALPESKQDYGFIKRLIFKIEKLTPAPC